MAQAVMSALKALVLAGKGLNAFSVLLAAEINLALSRSEEQKVFSASEKVLESF
jgi:hypothetical protein